MGEFIRHRQGPMTVGEYIKKFQELSRFAPHMGSMEALKID